MPASRSRPTRAVMGTLAGFALVVAACSWSVGGDSNGTAVARDPDATTTTSTPEPGGGDPLVDPGTLDWGACEDAGALECAALTVPLDWDEPDGTTAPGASQ